MVYYTNAVQEAPSRLGKVWYGVAWDRFKSVVG